jgi:DNA primase
MIAATARLSPEDITRVRAEHRITDVLRRAGIDVADRDTMISCPTPGHEDSTPSCIVHPGPGTFRCFGCGAHGDVFELVHEITGITNLAQAAVLLDAGGPITWRRGVPRGLTAVPVGPLAGGPEPDRTPRERIVEINRAAWRYLTSQRLADQARAYLARRGVDVWTLEAQAGAPVAASTPASKTGLTEHLHRIGCTVDEIVDAGWAVRGPYGEVDRFHHRVLLPIHDRDRNLAGVIGRDVTDHAKSKYLNTPRTAAYRKGELLYRPATTDGSCATVIVCEGPLDALAITAAAAARTRDHAIHAIAPCGTALTSTQADLIADTKARDLIICADSDAGGRAAAIKWRAALRARHVPSTLVALPPGHDPASWLTQVGPTGLDVLLDQTPGRETAPAVQIQPAAIDTGLIP